MSSIKFNIQNTMGSKSGTMLNNGFNSYRLIPKGDSDALDDKIAEAVDGYADDVSSSLNTLNNEANNLKDRVLNLSNNLETIHLSDAIQGEISSAIVQGTATFVTNNQAGAWYGLQIIQDAGGTEYISGFDMGALLNPSGGVNESYFRINADTFIVGGDLGDGNGYTGPTDINGEPIPAFSIVQDDNGSPQMYFNGKVNIQAIPESVNKYLGEYADFAALEAYLEDNPGVSVNEGDTYLNSAEQVVYMWDGDEWISTESKISYRSVVFKRADTKPDTPVGGNYSDSTPTGWSDGIPPHPTGWTTGMAITPIWASYSEFDNKTNYTDNPPVWTEPILTLDSATTDYLYHSSTTTPPTPTNTTNDTSIIQADIDNGWYNDARLATVWAAVRHKQQGVWTPWELTKIRGEDGSDGARGANGSRGSAILHGEGYGSFSSSDATSAFNDKFGYLVNGDQYIWTSTNYGTVIRTYNGSIWTDNTALTVHGDAIVDGTYLRVRDTWW